MTVSDRIRSLLSAGLDLQSLDIVNESHMHAGPATESHFKLVAVSADFEGLSAVKRHRLVYKLLGDLVGNPVHALALHTYTPAEWAAQQAAPASPNCMGGSKNDNKQQIK